MAEFAKKMVFGFIAFSLLLGTAFAGSASLTVNLNSSANYAPIPGALVKVWDSATNSLLDANYTSNAGSITFYGLPNQNIVKVTAEKTGYIGTSSLIGLYSPETRTMILAGDSNITTYLTKIADQNAPVIPSIPGTTTSTDETSASMDANAHLRVFAQDSGTGEFISEATVTLAKSGLTKSASTYSSGGTNYPADFASIPKGEYILTATKSGYDKNIQMLSLNSDATITISLKKTQVENHYLEVTVYDEQGATVPGAKVGVLKADSNAEKATSSLTDSSGVVLFNALEDTDYWVTASKTGYISSKLRTHSDNNLSIVITKKAQQTDVVNAVESSVRGIDLGGSTPELVKINGKDTYQITGNKAGRLFGVIPVRMNIKVFVDPITNEVTSQELPWWSFLVTG